MSEENNSHNQGLHVDESQANQNPSQAKLSIGMSAFSVLFNKSLKLFQHGLSKFVSLLLIPFLAYIVAMVFIVLSVLFIFKGGFNVVSLIFGILIVAVIVFAIILSIIAKVGIYIYIKDFQKKPLVMDILKIAQKKAWGFFAVSFLTGIFVMLWSFLFIIPGIIFGIYYSLSLWTYIYENKTGTNALRRSKELVKGYWWSVFGRYFLLYGAFYLLFIGTSIIVNLIFGDSIIATFWGFIIQIISFLIYPLFIIFSCFIYWDLKKIKGEFINKIQNAEEKN